MDIDIGKRIKELRERIGFTQNKLAEWAGVSQSHLRRVELGQQDITIGQLQLVCDGLGITLTEFFNIDNGEEDLVGIMANLSPKQKQLLVDFLKSIFLKQF